MVVKLKESFEKWGAIQESEGASCPKRKKRENITQEN